MSWRKHFKPASASSDSEGSYSPLSNSGRSNKPGPAASNYSSYLPDVYTGSPNRIERYGHYNVMDLDSEVNAGLDILAEFCTQKNKQNGTTFGFKFNRDATNSEVTILSQYLKQWFKLNQFETRMFQLVRNTFKYGDEIFIRDPETHKLFHIEASKIKRIIVNESEGKTPEQYVVSDINFNFKHLVATEPMQTNTNITGGGNGYLTGGVRGMVGGQGTNSTSTTRFSLDMDEVAVNAEHIVHISLSEGLDSNYPFGNSLLETVFKVYKQKELLEDAIIIYRVQRAPERRVFYVDVGNMPSHLAMQFVERVKTEIHQRRIPSSTGGGSTIDSTYNPLCLALDTKIPLLNGEVVELSEIINRFENGDRTMWAYSCNPVTGKSEPGRIDWAGVTRQDTETIKVSFDNGKSIICTPDHKFPVYKQGDIKAKDLDVTCALFGFDPDEKANSSAPTLVRVIDKQSVKNRDTGTLTIDIDHVHHDYHNFATDAGVYVKNSINEDFFFPQTCLSLDTLIEMSDKSFLTLNEIIKRYENGEQLYVSGVNEYFNPTIALIEWAGVTRKQAEVMDITLENGKMIKATPDHRFVLWNGVEIQAGDIRPGMRLMAAPSYQDNTCNGWLTIDGYRIPHHGGVMVMHCTKSDIAIDTGDITIGTQSHLFCIEAGIIVHNSEGRGSKVETLPGGCFAMDTSVLLMDGRNLTIREIENEMGSGKTLWTYSCNPETGELAAGLISWAGVTHAKADVRKIELSNGNHIICTHDHEFPVYGIGFKRADQFAVGDAFIPYHGDAEYQYDNMDRQWEFMNGVCADVTVTNVTVLKERIEVGTLTIDQYEQHHDFHTFSLSAGVFAKNSSLGEISDLKYFTNKLVRGLRIPSSYLPTGDDDGTSSYNDGRVGTAYIQELRFNNYCERLQGLLVSEFDNEFKRYLLERGVNIDTNMFDLTFEPPQNFASYRQAELDNSRVPTFTTMSAIPFISNRFALKRFLGLSDEEIAENETMWREENDENITTGSAAGGGDAGGAGLSSAGLEADMDNLDQELPSEMEDTGTMPDEGGADMDMDTETTNEPPAT